MKHLYQTKNYTRFFKIEIEITEKVHKFNKNVKYSIQLITSVLPFNCKVNHCETRPEGPETLLICLFHCFLLPHPLSLKLQ